MVQLLDVRDKLAQPTEVSSTCTSSKCSNPFNSVKIQEGIASITVAYCFGVTGMPKVSRSSE